MVHEGATVVVPHALGIHRGDGSHPSSIHILEAVVASATARSSGDMGESRPTIFVHVAVARIDHRALGPVRCQYSPAGLSLWKSKLPIRQQRNGNLTPARKSYFGNARYILRLVVVGEPIG